VIRLRATRLRRDRSACVQEKLRGSRGESRGARGEGRGARGEGRGARGEGRGARGEGRAPGGAIFGGHRRAATGMGVGIWTRCL
jgi:hypothetical protein